MQENCTMQKLFIHSGVDFFHDGQIIPNNSVIGIDDFGEDLESIFCITNKSDCCNTVTSENIGRWLLPDNTALPSNRADLFVIRGTGVISLNRIQDQEEVDDGLFLCEIPNVDGVVTNLYIGVYSNSTSGTANGVHNRIICAVFLTSYLSKQLASARSK